MTARPENGPHAPYVGLRPFEFHEAALFYGRGEHIAEMVRALRKSHFLAVVGSSGSGKSSLVRAGLLPAIAAGFMNGGEEAADWRFVIMRPGLDPYENLLRELLPKLAPGQSLDLELIEFRRQTLRGGPRGLVEVVADSLLPEPARLVVLVDQFEEIFRSLERGGPSQPDDGSSQADRRNAALAFVDMLLATTAERDPHVYVVLTMRSEYLGECEAFLGLSAAITKSQFLTPRMTREQIQDIIERPIEAVGGRIEPQVVTDLLNSLGTAQDQLPRVEHILLRMWNLAREARETQPIPDQPVSLTRDEYRAAGRFESALDQHAEQLYSELGSPDVTPDQQSEKQRVAEQLFRSLAVRSSQGMLVRRLSSLGEVASIAGASEQIVAEVVEHFRQSGCNFLVATPSAPLTGKTTLDISHEALLRQWARLGSWIENEAKSAEMYRRLADTRERYTRDEAGLLRGPRLQLRVNWLEKEKPTATWAERYHPEFENAIGFLKKSEMRARTIALGKIAIGLLVVVLAVVAVAFEIIANKEKEKALLKEKAASVTNLLPTKPVTALLLAIQATGEKEEKLPNDDLSEVQSSLLSALQGAKWSNLFRTAEGLGSGEDVISFWVLSSRDQKTIVSTHVSHQNGDKIKMVVRLWDGEGKLIGRLPEMYNFTPVAISPDGKKIITVTDSALQLWNSKGEHLKELPIPNVEAIAISADGETIVTGKISADKKGVVEFWNLEGESLGPSVSTIEDVNFEVVKISSDQQRILLLSVDNGGAWLLDRTGKLFKNLGDSVVSCEFSPDGQKIVTGSKDGTVRLLTSDGKPIAERPKAHEGYVFAVAFSSDGGIVSGGIDGSVRLWNISNKSPGDLRLERSGELKLEGSVVFSVAINQNGIVIGTLDGLVAFWPLDNVLPLKGHVSHENVGNLSSLAISPDGKTIIGGGDDGTVRLWNREGNLIRETSEKEKHAAEVTSVAISSDGTFVSGDADGTVRLWNREGRLIRAISEEKTGGAAVTSVAISPDGKTIIGGGNDGTVRLWNREGNLISETSEKEKHAAEVTSVAISLDGTIAFGDLKGGLKRWRPGDPESRRLLDSPPLSHVAENLGAKVAIESVAISPDGRRIVAGNEGGTVWLWNVADEGEGKPPRPIILRGHDQPVTSVAFSTDGQAIVSGSANGAVRLWDLSGKSMGSPLGRDTGEKDDVTVVAFSEEQGIVTVSRTDRKVWLWPIGKRENWLHNACNKVSNYAVLGDSDNNIAQEIAAHFDAGIVESAGNTCFKLGGWNNGQKANFLVRQGRALALRAIDSDVDKAVASFQEAQKLAPEINLDPGSENPIEKDPKAVAERLAAPARARAKVQEGGQLAQQGEIDKAIAAFQEAQQYVPDIDLNPGTRTIEKDPKAVAQQLAARAKVREGGQLAQQGEIDKAIAAFQKAQQYVPDIDLDPGTKDTTKHDPKAVAQQLAARAKVREGGQLAGQGDIAGAIAALQAAQQFAPDIDLDPETPTIEKDPQAVAQLLAARAKAEGKVAEVRALAKQGDIEKVLQAYAEAEKLDPSLKNKAWYWNNLGWWNSLLGHPKDGLDASKKAVELAKDDPVLVALCRDTRGLARALTGDAQGAIEDFEAAIASDALSKKKKAQRQQWVDALRKGQQPFTPELLKQLSGQ